MVLRPSTDIPMREASREHYRNRQQRRNVSGHFNSAAQDGLQRQGVQSGKPRQQ